MSCCLQMLSGYESRIVSLRQRPSDLPCLRYLLVGPLQNSIPAQGQRGLCSPPASAGSGAGEHRTQASFVLLARGFQEVCVAWAAGGRPCWLCPQLDSSLGAQVTGPVATCAGTWDRPPSLPLCRHTASPTTGSGPPLQRPWSEGSSCLVSMVAGAPGCRMSGLG